MSAAMKARRMVRLKLYVAGGTQNSLLALANLKAICRDHLPGRHEIEVIDVFDEPGRALEDRIFMTPALIRLVPSPVRRIVGTLSQAETVLTALGLSSLSA